MSDLQDALTEARCALSTIVGLRGAPNADIEIHCTALAALATLQKIEAEGSEMHSPKSESPSISHQ